MDVEKKVLDNISSPYAITLLKNAGGYKILAASEARGGPCRLYSPDSPWDFETIWKEPGGVMNMAQGNKDMAFWSIRCFFPVFRSENAEIVFTEKTDSGEWQSHIMGRLPFVHRIALLHFGKECFLLASTLCGKKDFEQDWSHPGAVYISPVKNGEPLQLKCIMEGLTKNHGLSFYRATSFNIPLISCHEGVFEILYHPDTGEWKYNNIFDHESSEAVLYDIDNDGQKELITIEGFHGDEINIYKYNFNQWKKVYKINIAFGHVLWAGKINGHNCVLSGNRDGEKDISLYFPLNNSLTQWDRIIIDEGVGPTQIEVFAGEKETKLFAANGSNCEVVVYTLKNTFYGG
jgi:hypothetical protein